MFPDSEVEYDLLQKLVEGDSMAFRQIYQLYQGRIFLFAYRLTKSKADAEEVVQEVFVKLWEKREKLNIEKNFSGYMLTITKNLVLDGLKRAAMDKKAQKKIYEQMQALKNITAEQMLQKELDRLHQQAVNALSPQRRTVYLLSREEELSYQQIATKLGISKNTVRNLMSEALQGIREHISNHPDLASLAAVLLIFGLIE